MGAESLTIVIVPSRPVEVHEVLSALAPQTDLVCGTIYCDSGSRRSFAVGSRGQAAIFEISVGAKRVEASFAVCHPANVDAWFVLTVLALSESLDGELVTPTNLPVEPAARTRDLLTLLAEKRALWRADFGAEVAVLTPTEAINRF